MTRNIDQNGLQGSSSAKTALQQQPSATSILTTHQHHPASASMIPWQKQKWNASDLPWRVTSDVTAAACASGLVAPLITMIDRGIIERASTCKPLRISIQESLLHLLTRPHQFLASKPFLLIFGLYFGTYATANTTDTVTNTLTNKSSATTNAGPSKFAATSAVNMSLCLYKDSQFTRMFAGNPAAAAASATASAIPKASYALFALRDSMTIFASFNLPPLIAPMLPDKFFFSSSEAVVEKHISRASAAQFLAPAAIQLISTPLHLLGLDLYNRPAQGHRHVPSFKARFAVVRRDWLSCSFARMGRIVPAFGVGGIVNREVRMKMIGRKE